MTDDDKPIRWTVVCKNFVSVHEDQPNAIIHAAAIINKGDCREQHKVMKTNLPYGSRHTKGTKR